MGRTYVPAMHCDMGSVPSASSGVISRPSWSLAGQCGALLALALAAPVLAIAGLAVAINSAGPLLVQVPYGRRDGRTGYRTEFRTTARFDQQNFRAGYRQRRATISGMILRATYLARLPTLFDVRAGRMLPGELFSP